MGLGGLSTSKINLFNSVLPPNTKKWYLIFLLVLLTATHVIILTFILPSPPSPRRSSTKLIFNNENQCSATKTRSALHSRGRRSIIPAKEDGEQAAEKRAVIVVLTGRKNLNERNLVRNTWGSIKMMNKVKILAVVFMLGSLDAPGEEVPGLDAQLESESAQFGDLVMGHFVDSYRNLTQKAIMAYEWLTSFCTEAQIVVKTDDDVMVNMFRLTEELSRLSDADVRSSNIWCLVHRAERPITKFIASKELARYFVSPDEFPSNYFPKHCAGVGYFTPMSVIRRILEEIETSFLGRVCTHEDVFMTGIVPLKLNSEMWFLKSWFSFFNSDWGPIDYVDKFGEWYSFTLDAEDGTDTQFLVPLLHNLANDTKNETENYRKFRERFQPRIFFLINQEFDFRFQRLWDTIVKVFVSKRSD